MPKDNEKASKVRVGYNTERLELRIPPRLKAKIEEKAEAEMCSPSEWARRALIAAVRKPDKP